jgi:hypothetical protein
MHILTKCTVQEAKSTVKNLIHIYTHVKFLALLGAPFICDISRLRVNVEPGKASKYSTYNMECATAGSGFNSWQDKENLFPARSIDILQATTGLPSIEYRVFFPPMW